MNPLLLSLQCYIAEKNEETGEWKLWKPTQESVLEAYESQVHLKGSRNFMIVGIIPVSLQTKAYTPDWLDDTVIRWGKELEKNRNEAKDDSKE